MELIIYIKMDLALNNLQKLICYKNPTNQPTNRPTFIAIGPRSTLAWRGNTLIGLCLWFK